MKDTVDINKTGHSNESRIGARDQTGLQQRPARHVEDGKSTYEELAERLRVSTGASDDVAENIAKNWQKIVGGIVVVLLGVWVWNEFQSAQVAKRAGAAEEFSEIQSLLTGIDFEKLGETKGDKSADKKEGEKAEEKSADTAQDQQKSLVALQERLAALQSRFPESPYSKFAGLYESMIFLKQGDVVHAKQGLEKFNVNRFANLTSASADAGRIKPEEFNDEFAALLYARMLLAEGKDAADARKRLIGLAYGGKVLNGEALLALYRISQTDAERAEAVDIAKAVVDKASLKDKEVAQNLKTQLLQVGIAL